MVSVEDLDLASFVGLPIDEARAAVIAAGGRVRTVHPGDAVTLDYRPGRVTLLVEDGRVAREPQIG